MNWLNSMGWIMWLDFHLIGIGWIYIASGYRDVVGFMIVSLSPLFVPISIGSCYSLYTVGCVKDGRSNYGTNSTDMLHCTPRNMLRFVFFCTLSPQMPWPFVLSLCVSVCSADTVLHVDDPSLSIDVVIGSSAVGHGERVKVEIGR